MFAIRCDIAATQFVRSLAIFVVLTVASASTLAANLTIPAGHPRIWFADAARLAQARAYYQTNPFTPGSDMQLLALRGLLTNNAQDCATAVNALMNFTLPLVHGDAFRDPIRTEGEGMISIYDWCHASLTPAQRNTLVARWNQYMDFDNGDTFANEGSEGNNYWWGRTRNTLMWGIASHGDHAGAQAHIDHALDVRMGQWFARWYNDFGRGGVFVEGSDYGVVMLSYPLVAFVTAADLGLDPYTTYAPFFRDAIYALYYGTTPGPTTTTGGASGRPALFPFGEDSNFYNGSAIAIRRYLGDFAAYMGQRDPSSGNARHMRQWLAETGNARDWLFDAIRNTTPGDQVGLPLDYYAPGALVFDLRTAHDPNAMQVHLQLGTPGGSQHSHTDGGTFQVWRKGRWITRETVANSRQFVGMAGQGIVSADHPIVHNSLLFEGLSTGRWIGEGIRIIPPGQPRQDNPNGLPTTVRLHHAPQFGYAALELSDAYRNTDGRRVDWPYADRAMREFLFIRPLNALLILDRMRGSSDSLMPFYSGPNWVPPDGVTAPPPQRQAQDVRRTFIMHFEQAPTLAGPRASATIGGQIAELITLEPAAPGYRVVDENLPPPQPQIGQHRLELDSVGTVESYFINIVHARDVGAPALQATMSQSPTQWTIQLNDPATSTSAIVVLHKGMTSQGGSIRIGSGPVVPLLEYVQRIEVTRDGPVWGPSDILLSDGFENAALR
jgi:hypothetical protein